MARLPHRHARVLERYPGDPADSETVFSHARCLDKIRTHGIRGADISGSAFERAPVLPVTRIDTFARVLRPVFRRDVALGLRYGTDSFLADPGWAAATLHRLAQ
ncbi:hypothetical protein ACH4TX_44090 [Streptomyces sp. NPDC021098]|uniref:hypothetical protein n=1 Tax=unclassified Streptomyces TaxID=2593676 RepID=UPI0037AE249E